MQYGFILQLSEFDYQLPEQLIARYPLPERDKSRLLVVNTHDQSVLHEQFNQLSAYFNPGDCLVLNNTKVMPARLYATKSTGGKVQILIERLLSKNRVLAQVGSNKKLKLGTSLHINEVMIKVLDKENDMFVLELFESSQTWLELMHGKGHLPLPPYIQRQVQTIDIDRYQTVFAQQLGAVAAPTAGLHFNDEMLVALRAKGIQIAFVTLHVGAGTFQPVRVEELNQHVMHKEQVMVNQVACNLINATKKQGKRVIAVGTTSLRAIESAAINTPDYIETQELKPYVQDTDLFIKPGFKFKTIDALMTNFHLPKSTLLMLVSALMGHKLMFKAYQAAIEENYRFFSYGDAMLIHSGHRGENKS